jgi:hypothetical protein
VPLIGTFKLTESNLYNGMHNTLGAATLNLSENSVPQTGLLNIAGPPITAFTTKA